MAIDKKLKENHWEFIKVLDECQKLRWKKLQDYGLIKDRFGTNGMVVRLYDKFARFDNLYAQKKPKNESLEDTLLDIINYSAMIVQSMRGKYDK